MSEFSLQVIMQSLNQENWDQIPGENHFYLSSHEFCVQIQWRIKFCLFKYFSFLGTVCYYPSAGWNHIILFMVTQINEDAGWDQYFMFLFLMLINVGSEWMRECGKIKISLSKPRLGKILLSYIKILIWAVW